MEPRKSQIYAHIHTIIQYIYVCALDTQAPQHPHHQHYIINPLQTSISAYVSALLCFRGVNLARVILIKS